MILVNLSEAEFFLTSFDLKDFQDPIFNNLQLISCFWLRSEIHFSKYFAIIGFVSPHFLKNNVFSLLTPF